MENKGIKIDQFKKIATVGIVIIIAVAIFLLWSNKVKYKDPLDYSGCDVTMTAAEVFEYNEKGTLRKEVENRIQAGIAREHENGFVEWIYKPGTPLPMTYLEVKNIMNAVVEAAVKIDDPEDEEIVYAGISVGPSPDIKKICRIKVVAGDDLSTVTGVQYEYDETKTTTKTTTNNSDTTKTTSYYVSKPSEDPVKVGYIFGGWFYTDSDGTEVRFDFDSQVTKQYDLWAKWYREETYGVEYELQTDTENTSTSTTKVEKDEINTSSSFNYFSEYNNAEYNIRYNRGFWHGFTKVYFSLLPLLLLLLGIILYRDLKAILWYKKRKAEVLEMINKKNNGI